MIRTKAIISISILFFLFVCMINIFAAKHKLTVQENHTPVVKITSPANNGSYTAGAQIHYSINVSDKEDGESKYDEIDAKQVLIHHLLYRKHLSSNEFEHPQYNYRCLLVK